MTEIKVLSLETATRKGSLAVLIGEIVRATHEGDEKSSHSPELLTNIKTLLTQTGVNLREINLIAAANGPGSFTGLRIGLATAKALSSALQIPAAGVSLLEAAAAQRAAHDKINCVIFPAGRGEVFAQIFSTDENGCQRNQGEVERIELKNLLSKNSGNTVQFIAPFELLNEIIGFAPEIKNRIVPFPPNAAVAVGKIALRNYKLSGEKTGELTALYAQPPNVGKNSDDISQN